MKQITLTWKLLSEGTAKEWLQAWMVLALIAVAAIVCGSMDDYDKLVTQAYYAGE